MLLYNNYNKDFDNQQEVLKGKKTTYFSFPYKDSNKFIQRSTTFSTEY
ncbi:Uncharacterised protein [Segatella copri]|nr:Uncharacterised protein [Segatella copri]